MHSAPLAPAEAVAFVLDVWADGDRPRPLSGSTIGIYAYVVRRFAVYLGAVGIDDVNRVSPEVVADYLAAAGKTVHGRVSDPALASSHVRRSALRAFYGTLRTKGLSVADPTLDVALPMRAGSSIRPLTESEAETVRFHSEGFTGTRYPAIVAMALSGMTPGEIIRTRTDDIDQRGRRVWARGTPQRDARWCAISGWEAHAIAAHLTHAPPGSLFTVNSRSTPHTSSASTPLLRVLRRAGLHDVPGIKPTSMPYYAAARAFARTGRIEEAALVLGARSLDAAAFAVDFLWRAEAAQ